MSDEPPENPDLVRALHEAAGGATEGKRITIYKLLADCRLLVELAGVPDPANPSASLIGLKRDDGQKAIAAFTHPGALRAFKPDAVYLAVVPASWLFSTALEQGFDAVLIDPAGPASWDIVRAEFEPLAQGKAPEGPSPTP